MMVFVTRVICLLRDWLRCVFSPSLPTSFTTLSVFSLFIESYFGVLDCLPQYSLRGPSTRDLSSPISTAHVPFVSPLPKFRNLPGIAKSFVKPSLARAPAVTSWSSHNSVLFIIKDGKSITSKCCRITFLEEISFSRWFEPFLQKKSFEAQKPLSMSYISLSLHFRAPLR
jgi:hypothetical protein